MRDITLLTKDPFRYENVHDLVLETFKGYKVNVDSPNQDCGRIYLEKGRNRVIDIDFTPDDTMSGFEYEFEEEQLKEFPFDAHLTCVLFRGEETIKRFVKALMDSGLEFYVHDEDSKIVKAKDFVPHADANRNSRKES